MANNTIEELLQEALIPIEEQPYQISENWIWSKFGSTCKLYNGYAFKSKDYVEDGIAVIRISDINDKDTNTDRAIRVPENQFNERYIVQKGDFLIAMSGATTGKYGLYNSDEIALQNQRVGNIKIRNTNIVSDKYKNYFIISSKDKILSLSYGGAQPNISTNLIESLSFPLPPLSEQQRIVDKIEYLFLKIDKAKELIEESTEGFKNRKAAILSKAFRGELTEKWRSENISIESAEELLERIEKERQKTYLNECEVAKGKRDRKPLKQKRFKSELDINGSDNLPSSWKYITLGDMMYDFKYGTSTKSDYSFDGMPVIRIPNIKNCKIESSDLKYLSQSEIDENNKVIEGDILIIRSNGSRDLVAKNALVEKEFEGYAYASYLIRIRPLLVNPKYVLLLLNENKVREQFFSKSKSSAGINNINTQELSTTGTPLPPLKEQKEIVRILDNLLSFELEIEELTELEDQIELLKRSILAKAFRGELGTNDPTEESAIELLKDVLKEKTK